MAIHHPLGIASGARGITKCTGIALVELRPFKGLWLPGHQLLVAVDIIKRGVRHVLAGGHHYPAFDVGTFFGDLLNQGHEIRIDKNVLIVGVVDDVDNLLWK